MPRPISKFKVPFSTTVIKAGHVYVGALIDAATGDHVNGLVKRILCCRDGVVAVVATTSGRSRLVRF